MGVSARAEVVPPPPPPAPVAAVPPRDPQQSSKEMLEEDVDAAFVCPITNDVMSDPVITADGMTYERRAIEAWFAQGNRTSPLTGLTLASTSLTPNYALRSAIEALRRRATSASASASAGATMTTTTSAAVTLL